MKNTQIVIADLNANSLNEVSADELASIQGGIAPLLAAAAAVAGYVIANWPSIKQGIADAQADYGS